MSLGSVRSVEVMFKPKLKSNDGTFIYKLKALLDSSFMVMHESLELCSAALATDYI